MLPMAPPEHLYFEHDPTTYEGHANIMLASRPKRKHEHDDGKYQRFMKTP